MLQNIRDKSKGPIITFIIGAICLMFAVTGVDSLLGSSSNDDVAKVNGEKVSQQELNEAIFLQKRRLIAQMGEELDPSMLDEKKLKEPALDDLIKRKILLQVAADKKMLIADSEIKRMISQNPDFQQNGVFSRDLFQATLAQAGLSPSLYKRLYSTDVLLQQVSSGIVDTSFATTKEMAIDARFTHQTRDIRYLTLSLQAEKQSIVVSDEDVKAYYDEHPEQFQSEESAVVDYIVLNQDDFKATIEDKDIQEVYNQEVANFKPEKQQDISHILAEVNSETSKEQALERITQIQEKIKGGDDFAELAREFSDDLGSKEAGGYLGALNADAFPESFLVATNALNKGEVSGVVETESGLHLIRINNVIEPKLPTYEERKEAIVADLQMTKSLPMYVDALEKLKDISFNSVDLIEPAEAVNAKIKTSSAVTRKGGAGIFSNKTVYNAIFKEGVLKNGENSEVIELGPTSAVVLRVKEHNPSALIDFAIVATKAKEMIVTDKAKEQLSVKANAIKNKVFAGTDIESIAKEYSYPWQVILASKRTNSDANQEIVNAAFKLPTINESQKAVDLMQKANGDYVVLTVSNVKDGDLAENQLEANTLKSFVARASGIDEFDIFQAGLRDQADVDIYQ
jgi:peptidyl-prolyl cis-trans isomerase D